MCRVLLFLFLIAAEAESQPFTFAWLSDTHVGTQTGARDLLRSVRDINRQKDVRFVLLSGDITETGSDAELLTAKSLLDSLRVPCHIIPGNHDTKWSESGGTTFRRIWGAEHFLFRENGFRFIGMHQGPRMRMADGHWAPEDVRWLEGVCKSLATNEPVFFVTHYPIDSSIANWYVVLDRLKELNVQLVLVGHGHRNRVEDFEGIPGAMCRSNLSDQRGRGGYTVGKVTVDSCILFERDPDSGSEVRWFATPLTSRRVSRQTGQWPRPSYSVNRQYPGVRSSWEYRTGFTVAAGPALWDTLVYVADGSGGVTCLGLESGREIWKYRTGGAIYSAPTASDGRVVVGSTDSAVVCLDARSGTLLWRVRTGAVVLGSAAIKAERVFIGGSDRTMRALNLETGDELWSFHGLQGFVECRPLVHQGKVVFGAWDEHLYALDATDGRCLWEWRGEKRGVLFSPAACWPVASGRTVFVVAPDREMTALDIEGGTVLWRNGVHQVRESIGISGDESLVFVRLMRDTVMAFRGNAPVQECVWATSAGFGYDINSAMLVEKGGTLFYGTKNGVIYALKSSSGALLWKHRVGAGAVHTLQPVSGSSVLCTDFDGIVRRVDAREDEKRGED